MTSTVASRRMTARIFASNSATVALYFGCDRLTEKTKKADVAKHPKVYHRVGLLINGRPD